MARNQDEERAKLALLEETYQDALSVQRTAHDNTRKAKRALDEYRTKYQLTSTQEKPSKRTAVDKAAERQFAMALMELSELEYTDEDRAFLAKLNDENERRLAAQRRKNNG